MGFKIVSRRDEEAKVAFRLAEGAASIGVNHGPYNVCLRADEGPFVTTEWEWEHVFSQAPGLELVDAESEAHDAPARLEPLREGLSTDATDATDGKKKNKKSEKSVKSVERGEIT